MPVTHLPLIRGGIHAIDAGGHIGSAVRIEDARALQERAADRVGSAALGNPHHNVPGRPGAIAGLVGLVHQGQVAADDRGRTAGAAPGSPGLGAVEAVVVDAFIASAAAAIAQQIQTGGAVTVGAFSAERAGIAIDDLVSAHDGVPVGGTKLG